jgi:hypothetical protein
VLSLRVNRKGGKTGQRGASPCREARRGDREQRVSLAAADFDRRRQLYYSSRWGLMEMW